MDTVCLGLVVCSWLLHPPASDCCLLASHCRPSASHCLPMSFPLPSHCLATFSPWTVLCFPFSFHSVPLPPVACPHPSSSWGFLPFSTGTPGAVSARSQTLSSPSRLPWPRPEQSPCALGQAVPSSRSSSSSLSPDWQVTRRLQDTSREHAAEQGHLSQQLSVREQSLEQTQLELAGARAELQRAWQQGNSSQRELGEQSARLQRARQELAALQQQLRDSQSAVSSLRACVNTGRAARAAAGADGSQAGRPKQPSGRRS